MSTSEIAFTPKQGVEAKKRARVGLVRLPEPRYPRECPYHPSFAYPEYPFGGRISAAPNYVFDALRRLFHLLGMDEAHWGTPQWNPLGEILRPDMTVVIKPNFVLSSHADGKDVFAIITHPSLLRALADYCWIALRGSGRIIIADAPQYNCDFGELVKITKLDQLCDFYASFAGPRVEFRDLRNYWSSERHFFSMLRPLPGDPKGGVQVDLGERSSLYEHLHPERFYGARYDREEVIKNQSGRKHLYEFSGTILKADAVISVPKLKVHKKVGVTLNVKGLMGAITNKNLCVHYTLGSPSEGGDQYPDGLFRPVERALIRTERWMYDHLLAPRKRPLELLHRSAYWLHGKLLKPLGLKVDSKKRILDAGNWHGNDSAWRMAADLLKIINFADGEGQLHKTQQRVLFSVVDGIVGGENNGPLTPDAKPAGILVGGNNLLAVDLVATRMMGFDPLKLKQFSILQDPEWDFGIRSLQEIEVTSEEERFRQCLSNKSDRLLAFHAHPGWVGHIEV